MKILQRHTQSQQQTIDKNDVDTNICVYIIFPGGFAADFDYAVVHLFVLDWRISRLNIEYFYETKKISLSRLDTVNIYYTCNWKNIG